MKNISASTPADDIVLFTLSELQFCHPPL